MRVVVIGIGGVGMAHICAAGRLGLDVTALIDTNPNVLRKAKEQWVNKWGDYQEEVEVQPNTVYSEDIRELSRLGLGEEDLIIIATPPHTHKALIRICLDFSKAKILVEKPISNDDYKIWNPRLIVSSEWVFHKELQDIESFDSLGMAYPEGCTTSWGYKLHPLLDFSSHLFSNLLVKNCEIIFLVKRCLKPTYFEIAVDCVIGYERKVIELWGERRSNLQGLWVNKNYNLQWQDNLFDLQLSHIKRLGQGPVDFQEMLSLENQVKKFLSSDTLIS